LENKRAQLVLASAPALRATILVTDGPVTDRATGATHSVNRTIADQGRLGLSRSSRRWLSGIPNEC
jgi:hypothetical protein